MFDSIKEDIRVVFERDPAARGILEVVLCYPGFHAILMHRWHITYINTNYSFWEDSYLK